MDGLQALMFFDNGYGVSVVRFKFPNGTSYGSYTNNEQEWELAVIKGNAESWNLCYDTTITDDVLGYLSNDDVSDVMCRVQSLPDVFNQ